jgi:hypothetical protein
METRVGTLHRLAGEDARRPWVSEEAVQCTEIEKEERQRRQAVKLSGSRVHSCRNEQRDHRRAERSSKLPIVEAPHAP